MGMLFVIVGSLFGICLLVSVAIAVVSCVNNSCERRPSTDPARATICTMEESEFPRPSICTVAVGAPASPPSYAASKQEGQSGGPLEGQWTVHHDVATGQPYWCCTRTGQTTWDPPAVLLVNTGGRRVPPQVYVPVKVPVKGDSA